MIRTPMGRALKDAGAGRRWPVMIVGLLLLNVTVVAVTVVFATRDRSFAIEPDYYRKAVEWDRTARERERASALGWDVAVSLGEPRAGSPLPVLKVTLRGGHRPTEEGVAMDGAQVQIEAFAQARSAERISVNAEGVGNGVYEAPAPIARPGVWEVRLKVRRGPDSLSFVRTLLVPGALAQGGDR